MECLHKFDDMYVGIHKLIASRGEIESLNLQEIAETLEIDIDDVMLMYELGYFERDIQTYCRTSSSDRQRLAKEFGRELALLREHSRTASYGGRIYRRK